MTSTNGEMTTCTACDGSGQSVYRGAARHGYDEPDYTDTCGICGGSGELPASMFTEAEDDEDDEDEPGGWGWDEADQRYAARPR